MIFWFVIVAPVIVAEIFRSPMIDYRMVALGSLLPIADLLIGQAGVLHTLVGAVGSLALVMVATIGRRRLLRRKLLGIPIGLMLHLVIDFVWLNDRLLLWPAFGSLEGQAVPVAERSMSLNLGLELIAVGVGVWAYRRYELDQPENMARLRATGQLPRSVMTGRTGA